MQDSNPYLIQIYFSGVVGQTMFKTSKNRRNRSKSNFIIGNQSELNFNSIWNKQYKISKVVKVMTSYSPFEEHFP